MATILRSSPARGAPRFSPHGSRAKATPSLNPAAKTSSSLVFQPQLLDSASQEERSSPGGGLPQSRKSSIPSPSKQTRQLPHEPNSNTSAEDEDSASSTMSTLNMADISSVLKPLLSGEHSLHSDDSTMEHVLPGSAIINQAFEGSATSDVTVLVLSRNGSMPSTSSMSMGDHHDGTVDLKTLISSPAFLKAVKTGANSKSPYKAVLRLFAATATTILSCALIVITLVQQQRFASWDHTVPA